MSIQLSQFFPVISHGLNTRPFDDQTSLDHLNTRFVCYSDLHCTLQKNLFQKKRVAGEDQMRSIEELTKKLQAKDISVICFRHSFLITQLFGVKVFFFRQMFVVCCCKLNTRYSICYETIMFGRVTYTRRRLRRERSLFTSSHSVKSQAVAYTRVICYDYLALYRYILFDK